MPRNRLIASSSAYLKGAGHQPIDWHEFGDAAFEKAKELDRPILLDIGAIWCHWCHVIDRESYENEEIARLINEHYIAVKVDRDQRPDVDARYQQVVASLTGQGGWPLTAFLTYDGRVLFGGTYFPPETMRKLLIQIKDIYREQREEILQESLDDLIREEATREPLSEDRGAEQPLSKSLLLHIVNSANGSFDTIHGGFGLFPKFPHFSTLEFLIHRVFLTGDDWQNEIIEKTLTQMAGGGIHDHIGGGFHRYSVDRQWHVPHFEKMAYDNAEALRVYTLAYRLQNKPLYLEVIEGILRFVSELLSDPENGGFYASQNADVGPEDDGDHFTWTIAELEEILSPEEKELIMACYDVTPTGDIPDRPGRNVLRISKSPQELAHQFQMPVSIVETRIQSANRKLAEKRRSRPMPFIDKTLYLNWNGMFLGSYFEVADLLNRPDMGYFAQKTLDRLLKSHVDDSGNRLLHTTGVSGFLEDYAWMIDALLKGYRSIGEKRYLEAAVHWTKVACDRFEDKTQGGFYDIETPEETAVALLKLRRKPVEDTPSSSANGVMIRNLLHLHWLTSEKHYLETAERALKEFSPLFLRQGLFVAALGISLLEFLHPPLTLEVSGPDAELTMTARRLFYPGKIISYGSETARNEVRLCRGRQCLARATTVSELESQLKQLLQ